MLHSNFRIGFGQVGAMEKLSEEEQFLFLAHRLGKLVYDGGLSLYPRSMTDSELMVKLYRICLHAADVIERYDKLDKTKLEDARTVDRAWDYFKDTYKYFYEEWHISEFPTPRPLPRPPL